MSIRNFFLCAFLMAGSVFSVPLSLVRIKISNCFFYRSAFGYCSPCEGFYLVWSIPLFFIQPRKVAHSIHGTRRRVQRHFFLAGKSAAISSPYEPCSYSSKTKEIVRPQWEKFIPLRIECRCTHHLAPWMEWAEIVKCVKFGTWPFRRLSNTRSSYKIGSAGLNSCRLQTPFC